MELLNHLKSYLELIIFYILKIKQLPHSKLDLNNLKIPHLFLFLLDLLKPVTENSSPTS